MPRSVAIDFIGDARQGQHERHLDEDHRDVIHHRDLADLGHHREDRREHEDGQHEHEEHEAGAAARMKGGARARVIERQVQPVLVRVDDLVLSPVVLKYPPNLGYQRDAADIGHKNAELEDAVEQVKDKAVDV